MSFETNLNELSNQHLAFVILHLFLSRQLVHHYVAPYTCFVVKKHFPISNDHSAQHDVILKRQFGMQKRERESLRLDASSTRYLISDCVMMTNTDRSLPISPAVQHSLLLLWTYSLGRICVWRISDLRLQDRRRSFVSLR